jgi:hypothetical protein
LQQSLNIGRWGKTRDDAKANLEKTRREHDKYVLRVLDIIEHFKPKKWFIENPWSSNMKTIPQLKKLASYRFDYCRFGFDYQKPTRIWSNVELESKPCNCFPKKQKEKTPNKHKTRLCIQGKNPEYRDLTKSTDERYQIPEQLVEELLEEKIPRKHKKMVGCFERKRDPRSVQSTDERYQIPEQLVGELLEKN